MVADSCRRVRSGLCILVLVALFPALAAAQDLPRGDFGSLTGAWVPGIFSIGYK
jgi:hypothetical protein